MKILTRHTLSFVCTRVSIRTLTYTFRTGNTGRRAFAVVNRRTTLTKTGHLNHIKEYLKTTFYQQTFPYLTARFWKFKDSSCDCLYCLILTWNAWKIEIFNRYLYLVKTLVVVKRCVCIISLFHCFFRVLFEYIDTS